MRTILVLAALAGLAAGDVVAVCGLPGSGKTTAVVEAERAGAWTRRVVLDPLSFRDDGSATRTRWGGDRCTAAYLARHPEVLDRDPLRLVVSHRDPTDAAALALAWRTVAGLAYATGGITVVAEESPLYAREAARTCLYLTATGGHADLRVVMLAQSPTRLPIDARRHLTRLVLYPGAEPADLEYLRQRCGRDVSDRVAALRPGDPPVQWAQGQGTLDAA